MINRDYVNVSVSNKVEDKLTRGDVIVGGLTFVGFCVLVVVLLGL